MSRSWRLREVDDGLVARVKDELSVHPVTARCLVGRGVVDGESGRSFLEPRLSELRSPEGLAGLTTAIDRLVVALEGGQTIGVFGDYDADGVTTTALLTGYLRALGASCIPRVARRDSGYGFGVGDAEALAAEGCEVVITADCGTSDLAALGVLRERGIDAVVIDHHTVPESAPDRAHPALALINPFRPDSEFPFRGLASVGLGFYVMAALRSRLRSKGYFEHRVEPDIREQLDLVALGTIADLVPLTDENRILTRMGLERLRQSQRPGLRALMDNAGLAPRDIGERAVGFKIGPRLNAPGRLGDATPALDVLLAATPAVARAAAAVVEQLNDQRRAVQDEVMADALARLGEADPGPAVVVAGVGWSSGVVGIVAARLVELYQRPAFVIAIDEATGQGRGSCRTYGAVNLYETLSRTDDVLVRYGGHAAAAGLTIAEDQVDAFRERVARVLDEREATDEHQSVLADAEVAIEDLDERLVRELEGLAPFGKANDEPTLVARGVKVRGSRRVGDGSHLKLELIGAQGRTVGAIGFGLGERDPGAECRVDLAFRPAISTWGGRLSLELQLRDLSPSEASDGADVGAAATWPVRRLAAD